MRLRPRGVRVEGWWTASENRGRITSELRALVAAAGIPAPHVIVGHSFGGLTARLYAHRYPGDVAGLVLLDPAYPEDWREPSDALAVVIRRGVVLCRYGYRAARLHVSDLVDVLIRLGAIAIAPSCARPVSAGALRQADEEVLAPVVKLPKEGRSVARRMWTQPRFFEALGSQIESIRESAAEVPADQDFGDLPVVVVSGELNSDEGQLSRQARLAGRSRRGRHVVAKGSGHWIPLERPDVVVQVLWNVIDLAREPIAPSSRIRN